MIGTNYGMKFHHNIKQKNTVSIKQKIIVNFFMHGNDNLQCISITKSHNKGKQKNILAKKKKLFFSKKLYFKVKIKEEAKYSKARR